MTTHDYDATDAPVPDDDRDYAEWCESLNDDEAWWALQEEQALAELRGERRAA